MYLEGWHLYDKKGKKRGEVYLYLSREMVSHSVFNTFHCMDGWGKKELLNWLKSVGWRAEDK